MLANRWRNGTRQFSLVSSRVAQSRVDKIEIGDNPITGTVTVANWMFRSTMDGKVQRSIHPVVWVSSIPIRRGQRTRPLAPPWKPFPSVNCVRIHPSGSATTTRTHGWNMDGRKRKWLCSNTCVPEQSEGKGGGGWMQMLDLRLPTTLVYCRIICFGSKRKKGLARWSNEACKRVGNLGRGDLDDEMVGDFRMGEIEFWSCLLVIDLQLFL